MTSNIMLTLAFLAGVLAVYYLTPRAGRLWILLAASLLFYLSADPRMLLLSGGSALWSYFAGIRTEEAETKKEKKLWLAAAVVPVLLVLFVFKYLNFFTESFAALLSLAGLSAGVPVLSLVLPLGISYYTFKMISYNADIYLGKREAEKGVPGLCAYLTYILFFPQILSGPIERSEGFMERMKEKYPDIKVLPVQYSDGDPQKAMDKTIDMIQANPDLAGIYGTNEGSTLGVANAIDSQNLKGKVKVIGFDSTEAIINFLKNGVIQGFVVQDAYQIGYQGIKTLNAALSGQAVEKEIDIPVKFVNAENINTPEIDKLLHPFGKK